ncbi:MAG TPA: hypothetical protein VN513_01750 [Gemmatimonadales bacterium]|nr:hypothetical protein [Gemmatimonadales bacterium]
MIFRAGDRVQFTEKGRRAFPLAVRRGHDRGVVRSAHGSCVNVLRDNTKTVQKYHETFWEAEATK